MICDDLHAEVATLKNRIRETEDQLRIGREEIAEYERKHVQAVTEFERKHQQTVAEYERTRIQQKKENQALAA